MDSKVFVARVPEEPYMEISSGGEFGNPITSTFSLRDTGKFKYMVQQYYVVVLNSVIGYIQLEALGQIPGFEMGVSWVNDDAHYSTKITKELSLDATNRKETIQFFVKFKVLDDLDVITRDQYRNIIKLRLVWA
jgi:hypothetical protein